MLQQCVSRWKVYILSVKMLNAKSSAGIQSQAYLIASLKYTLPVTKTARNEGAIYFYVYVARSVEVLITVLP